MLKNLLIHVFSFVDEGLVSLSSTIIMLCKTCILIVIQMCTQDLKNNVITRYGCSNKQLYWKTFFCQNLASKN
ncbi:hypothetical protein VNO78_15453 [Psophocarpus tetragonolobus]|uniref:Uncharacterized protein n=1 Tax=Psophocarpus tetragonolobus TaxID=3891 RepID=A0AAN9SF10_PSOTE